MSLRRLGTTQGRLAAGGLACLLGAQPALADPAADAATADSGASPAIEQVTVTAERLELLGLALTASEGIVDEAELSLLPAYRPGQLLETVPGLIVTLHSGEGKANQYLMRGYNLDHGTDLATFVDGMPVNQPTHAHGQGYTDLNFLIPELADTLSYTKGTYYADVGDFGAVGSVRVNYRDSIPDQMAASVGTLGFQRMLGAGSTATGNGELLGALELQHYDGPFVTPDDQRKENAALRYSEGDGSHGLSLTAMFYHALWTNTTDIPLRAIADGEAQGRFGTLDPTDGGIAWRASLSFNRHDELGGGMLRTSAYEIENQLHLYNNFTHFLADPVYGDQEDQMEHRHAMGGQVSYTLPTTLGGLPSELLVGASTRYDLLHVGRDPSEAQLTVPAQYSPPSFTNDDRVWLFAGSAFVQETTHWTASLRSVFGLRDDYQHGTDIDYEAALHETAGYANTGTASQALIQPKGSLIYTVSDRLELYASAGRGFHSADLRGVNQDVSVDLGLPHTHLLSRQEGQEVGLRASPRPDLAVTFALFNLWQQSETIIDPDVGADSAGPPSRRYGLELNVTYRINPYLEFYGSASADHTRFTHPLDDGTGHLGDFITDAPVGSGMLALYLTNLGAWSGGLTYRYLGNYPLSSGPCNDRAAVHDFPGVATGCASAPTAAGQVNAKGFGETNLDVHYALGEQWNVALGIYNLFNVHASAARFWYVDRLASEIGISADRDGRADVHEHPLEPIMARLTLSKRF